MDINENYKNSGNLILLTETIDKNILSFLNRVTEPWKNEHDIQVFNEILNGKRFEKGRTIFDLKIGSARLMGPITDQTTPFYDELKIHIKITSECFYMIATLFHNSENKTEGFSYHFEPSTPSELKEETWVLPEGNNGRKLNLFMNEFCNLLHLNRDIRVFSELEPLHKINQPS